MPAILWYFFLPSAMNFLIIPLPDGLRLPGIGAGCVGFGLQMATHKSLRDHRASAKNANVENMLIQDGPFRWIRHPLYFSLILMMISWALVAAYLPFMLPAVVCIPFFDREAEKEEMEMRTRCGGAYDDYCGHTGRFIPVILRRVRE